MTTVQESTNGHRVFPPPCSLPHPQEENQSKDSPNNNSQFAQHGNGVVERQKDVDITSLLAHEKVTQAFPANAYHVPPPRYAPKPNSYRYDDFPSAEIDTTPLPERCQFMFSDGRQCTMGRSEIHPSLCPYHSEREDQLFGTPSSGGSVVGAAFDLPELYSACRDLTTAAGVNRALGQVFRLLAQRRISRQEAATFAKLGHLLLQTISTARSESTGASENEQPMIPVVERQKDPSSNCHPNTKPPAKPGRSFRATIRTEESQSLNAPPTSEESLPHITRPSLDAPSVVSHALSEPTADKNSSGINTSVTPVCNSREINTSTNAELKVVHNEHLHKNGRGAGRSAAETRVMRGPCEGGSVADRE